jgi:hypothetical protein
MLFQISGDRLPTLLHRYSKLSDDKLDQIEDIADDALKGVVTSSALPLMTGLGVGFGISAFSGFPVVGMAAAGYFLYSAVDSALAKGKQAEYIKDHGRIAHCLDESNLIKYCQIVGPEAAIDEILKAYQDNQTITTAARKLCNAMGQPPKRRTIAAFLEEIQQLKDLPHESDHIGLVNNMVTVPTIAGGNCKIHTAVNDMVNPVRSSYISGPPRTGKGILEALAMKEFKTRYPKGTLYTYTPKQDPKEHWYWESSDQHFNPDLDQNPTRAAQSLYAMIRHWQSLPSASDAPILFVVDELSTTLGRLKPVKMSEVDDGLFSDDNRPFPVWLMDFLVHEASLRQSVDRFVWVMTPLNTVTETGVSAGALKSLRNYTIASRENLKFADGGNATFAAPKITADHPLLSRYRTIAYSHDSQTWLPIPTIAPNDLERFTQSNPSLKMWGEMPAIVGNATWEAASPAAVFTAAYSQAFMGMEGAIETNVQDFTEWFPDDAAMLSFIDWLSTRKESTNEVLYEQIKGSYWAKKYGRDRSSIDRVIALAVEYGFLISTNENTYTIGEW